MSFTQQGISKKIGLVLWFIVFVALGFGLGDRADAGLSKEKKGGGIGNCKGKHSI